MIFDTISIAILCGFVGGFALASGVYYDYIRIGVQVKRETKQKIKQGEKLP